MTTADYSALMGGLVLLLIAATTVGIVVAILQWSIDARPPKRVDDTTYDWRNYKRHRERWEARNDS